MKQFFFGTAMLFATMIVDAAEIQKIIFDFKSEKQTIHSFGASDCWRTQYIGKNWPLEKREKIADLLFSSEFDEWGNPKGIGLSLWRFNIGSGSHEAGENSGISSLWRRTECFLDNEGNWNWDKQEGQKWMLEAARKRGVKYTLGFSITAPYFMTKNGMARASEKNKYANIREDAYDDYASFMAEVSDKLRFDYLSPINEPQWEWVGSNQEGMQATNEECSRLIHLLDKEISKRNSKTKIVFGEAGDIRYLYRKGTDKPDRDNQIKEIFSKDGKYSISNLKSVEHVISGHSYWSTWPLDTLIQTREELYGEIKKDLPEFTYWQTEYCPMEKNKDNPNGGGGRDLTMNTALYVARVIHYDLTVTNAASWQWWTAFSEWNYKDGLIFVDDGILSCGAAKGNEKMIETCKNDGVYRTSKLLWALGNYSFFVRPGMTRIAEKTSDSNSGILASAYIDSINEVLSVVLVNNTSQTRKIDLSFISVPRKFNTKQFKMYETSDRCDLQYKGETGTRFSMPPNSIITLSNK